MLLSLALLACVHLSFTLTLPSRRDIARPYSHAANSISLKSVVHSGPRRLHKRQESAAIAIDTGFYVLLPVSIGSQVVDLLIDTGSADLWVAAPDYRCFASFTGTFHDEQYQSNCNLRTSYVTSDQAFTPIDDHYLVTTYGGGTVTGYYGSAPVTIGSSTFDAEVAIAYNTTQHIFGDALMNGFIGLPYSAVSDYRDGSDEVKKYNAITTYWYEANPSLPQCFSLAVTRATSDGAYGGSLTIGGIPNPTDPHVNIDYNDPTLPVSVNIASVPDRSYVAWTIYIDGWAVSGDSWATLSNQGVGVIVDSGDPSIRVPTEVAESLWALYTSPPNSNGVIDCNAKFQGTFGVKIGGRTFDISPEDMIVRTGDNCWTVIADGNGLTSLGLPFLRNVLAVFDHGRSQLAFWPRQDYQS